ncbi:MAG: PqqD family protein, partial [Lachnospiraceae bacterium]
MIQNPNYVLKEIADVAYLLPTGQEIADFKKGLKLNATSAYIWELLKNDLSLKELMDALIIHYEADAKEAEALKKDVTAFVQLLSSHGMLLWEDRIPEGRDGLWHTLTIAGLGLSLYGNGELFSDRLLPFCTPVTDPLPAADLTVSVLIGSPAVRKNGRVIVRNRELIIMEDEEHFILLFPSEPQILEA